MEEKSLPITLSDRLFRVVESGMTQTLLGIVGGMAGTFLDGRYFVILTPFIPAAIQRNKALEGIERPYSWICFSLSVLLTAGLLWWCGVSLNHAHPNTYTPSDYASAIVKKLPRSASISISQIVDVPKPSVSPSPELKTPEPPPLLSGTLEERAWDINPLDIGEVMNSLVQYQAKNNFKKSFPIYYLRGSRESYQLAQEMRTIFESGGWIAQLIPRTDISYINGLVLIQSSVELRPAGTEVLLTLAKKSSIPLEIEEEPERVKPESFEVWIGNPKRTDPIRPPL